MTNKAKRAEIIEKALDEEFGGRPGMLKRHGGFEYRWRAGPLWNHESRYFAHRDLQLVVERGMETVATMSVTEFKKMDDCDNDEFFDYADCTSQTGYDFARNVLSVFDDTGPLEYADSVLLISRLCIKQGTPPEVWSAIREAIVGKFKTSCDFVAFQAFPLEFENSENHRTSKRTKAALERRRNAMFRHYVKNLGGTPIGDEGWMLSHIKLDLEPNPSWAKLTPKSITYANHPTDFAIERKWLVDPSKLRWSPEDGVTWPTDKGDVGDHYGLPVLNIDARTEIDYEGDEEPGLPNSRSDLAHMQGRSSSPRP